MKEGRKPEFPEKTHGEGLQKKPEDSSPEARLEPAQQHWWQARKADVLTVTPRVVPFLKPTSTTFSLVTGIND